VLAALVTHPYSVTAAGAGTASVAGLHQVVAAVAAAGLGSASVTGLEQVLGLLVAAGLGTASVAGTAVPPGRDITVVWGPVATRQLSGSALTRSLGLAMTLRAVLGTAHLRDLTDDMVMRDLVLSLEG
jgi:hypothetical protein